MPYDANSTNNFVQKQGGNLANLGASPSYTGAPVQRGTPPGQQGAGPQMPMPYQSGQMPMQASLQNLGQRMTPQQMMQRRRMQPQDMQRGRPQMQQRGQMDPRMAMMQRQQQMPQQMRGQPMQGQQMQQPGMINTLGQRPQYRR